MPLGAKFDYPPLLAPGRHVKTLAELERQFLDGPLGTTRRREVFQKIEEFVQGVLRTEVPCEVWINGSFLTENPEPSDADLTVILDADVAATLSSEQAQFFEAVATALRPMASIRSRLRGNGSGMTDMRMSCWTQHIAGASNMAANTAGTGLKALWSCVFERRYE